MAQATTKTKGLQVRRVGIDTLAADPANVRVHPKAGNEAIAASLRRFGQQKPIVVDSKGVVRAGNGTLQAARDLGWTEIDVVVSDLSDIELVAYAIADNRTTDLSMFDDEALTRTLQSLDMEGAFEGLGFSRTDLERMGATEAHEDDGPGDLPEEAVTKPGDLWTCGDHRILCGDSTSAQDVERLLAGVEPFLMVTDPPYGVEYDPEWRHETGLNNSDRTGKVQNDDRVDWSAAWALFPGDVCYVWHAGRFAASMVLQLNGAGFDVRSQIIWAKRRFAISRGHYHWQHEPCWYAVRKGKPARWIGDRTQSTVWSVGNADGNDAETVHGTQKPVEIMARPMRNHGAKGDVVYEPFLGSGTTLIAAEQTDRVLRAMEIDPRYVDVAVQRWEKLSGLKATRS